MATTPKTKSVSDNPQMTEEVQPEPVVTIQDQGIGPQDPYPTGSPPDQEETYTRVHSGSRVTDGPNVGTQTTKKE
jgi:hypothetical protein